MERWLTRLRVRLRTLFRPTRAAREVDEELQFHLDREIQERRNAGLTPDDARRAALRAMGAIEKSREECRDQLGGRRLRLSIGRAGRDLRFALRLFRKHPASVGIAAGGLALAIGVTTAVFSIVNATMLRPYGMDDPPSVVAIARPGHVAWVGWSYPAFLRMRAGTSLAQVEAATRDRVRFSAERAGLDGPNNHHMLFVSGEYQSMLGARPALGRTLVASDDLPGAPPVVVLSHRFWETTLGSHADVVGRTVWVNDAPAVVVGVLERGVTGPVEGYRSIWATLAAYDDLNMGPAASPAAGPTVEVIARLARETSPKALQDNLSAVVDPPGRPVSRDAHGRRGGVEVQSAASPIAGHVQADELFGLVTVMCIVGLVLLLACANAATLLSASAATRAREVGVRLAMGASRGRLVAQLLTESLLLGLLAGAAGFVLAIWLVPIFGHLADLSADHALAPDWRVLAFAIAVAVACGLGAGLSPARHGARGNVLGALQTGGTTRRSAVVPSRLRLSFVGFQAAVSMLLLVVAALLTRTAVRMTHVDIGYDADRLVAVGLARPPGGVEPAVYLQSALAAVRAVPSVERVSVSQYEPFGLSGWRESITHRGTSYDLNRNNSDEQYFQTTGVRVLRGRSFTAAEVAAGSPVALVSESVARAFYPGRDALGQSIASIPAEGGGPRPDARIIGVVADAFLRWFSAETFGSIYMPLEREPRNPPSLIIRTRQPAAAVRDVEEALWKVDSRTRRRPRIVREHLDSYLDSKRRLAWMLGPAAVLALLLAAFGVYGVSAFVVSQRTKEVSVRLAMGATSYDVLRLLLVDGLRPVAVGLVVGLGLALVVSRVFAQMIAGISPHDPMSIAVALALLLAAACVAVVMPARRAASADPAGLLRHV